MITSNRESGFGRYDVILEPKNKGVGRIRGSCCEMDVAIYFAAAF